MSPLGVLFHFDGLDVEEMIVNDSAITLVAAAATDSAACPTCHAASTRVHSRYWRTLCDLPWADVAVTLRLRVRRFLAAWREGSGRRGPTPRRVAAEHSVPTQPAPQPTRVHSTRQARWLLLRKDDDLDEEDLAYRDQLIAASDEIQTAKRLADDFGKIIRELDVPGLHMWMETAQGSDLPEFRGVAVMLRRDLPAVEAALTHRWSNGQTEGQISRLKFLRRQMYGRASMELLRRRFLPAA